MSIPLFMQPVLIGELRDVRLFNFSIAMDEARRYIPEPLQPRNFRGRAVVSMADVQIAGLRPAGCALCPGLSYRHIVLRMLIDDGRYSNGEQRGAWFFRSFAAQPWIARSGNLLTEFNFHTAVIGGGASQLAVQCGTFTIFCEWEHTTPPAFDEELRRAVQTLDRAYSVHNGRVLRRDIERSRWLPVPATCRAFSCSGFDSIRFEGLFRISQPVSYRWFPQKEV